MINAKTGTLPADRMINFSKNSRKVLIAVAALFLVFTVMLIINGVQLDIQFTGGSILTYSYEGDIDLGEVEQLASDQLSRHVTAQIISDIGTDVHRLVLNVGGREGLSTGPQDELFAGLQEKFPDSNIKVHETLNVDPFIGGETLFRSGMAILISSVLILAYVAIRFRTIGGFSAGIAAALALLHDVTVVFFTFVIFKIPLNDGFIAVVLTIFGYSINDTIIIYDRVRENAKIMGPKADIRDVVDLSESQTFARTVNTALMTLISMVIVFVMATIFGLTSIQIFSLPIITGIVAGFFSTVFLSVPLWGIWKHNRETKMAKKA